ncbi:MAG: DUF58 domain-containing protein [Planctomycetaceae bacterium]|nr:DUF58 domain-containing protein [Planctomycetaceae bacterium]
MPLFDDDFLQRLDYLSLVSRRAFAGQMMAQRRSRQLGSGIEFADHRQYTAGDDFRYLDWNLYARHGELLLKRFQEEQDLHVYLLLDCSCSMAVDGGVKFDLARQLTAALAYIALSDLDRIAVFAFADGVLHEFALTRGKARIVALMDFLNQLQATGAGTSLPRLVSEFVQRAPRPGLAVLLSDLFAPEGYQTSIDRLRYQRFEPHVVQIHSPQEAAPGLLGDVELVDSESGEQRRMTVTEQQVRAYQKAFESFLTELRQFCLDKAVGCSITDTSVAYDDLVLQMLRSGGASLS